MNQALREASDIYQSICMESMTGRKRGISVQTLKKEYHMKKRDIKAMIAFLNSYDMAGDTVRFSYEIYKLTSGYTSEKDDLPFDCLDEGDVEEVDLEEGQIDNQTYIKIMDSVMILGEKMKEGNIDPANASLIHSIQNEMNQVWNKISDVKMDADYVIIKEERTALQTGMRAKKMDWVWAVVKGNVLCMKYRDAASKSVQETIIPLGMYYNRFLDQYICVYQKEDDTTQRGISLDQIDALEIQEDAYRSGISFHIDEYIKRVQTERMVLHVYKEANVIKKLETLLCDNQLVQTEEEEYHIFTFMTEHARQYMDVINSYGKSVVVIEPEDLRQEILRSTKEALAFYQSR